MIFARKTPFSNEKANSGVRQFLNKSQTSARFLHYAAILHGSLKTILFAGTFAGKPHFPEDVADCPYFGKAEL